MANTSQTHAPGDIETIDVSAVNSKENRALYQARKKIHPRRAYGSFRRFKWIVMLVTLGIYYVTPWLRWDRGPGLPDQAVLLDLANRRFYFFFIEIWPHEFFYIAGMLVMAGIGLFLVTTVLGRAWCGYTCPQTVWVDLFLAVERFFEGDRNARIKLDDAPWTAGKLLKRTLKHAVWLFIAVATGGAWIFYFADAPDLFVQLFTLQASSVAYATVGILTATTYVFGGFMREQVCTYMCPWPRIQAAMLDTHSLTVTYNAWRGEPRSRHTKRLRKEGIPTGDCVDCNACIAVCPMGIDIRDGQQLECITCALCIDACDNVMEKLGLEKGLISYTRLKDYDANMALASGGGAAAVPQIDPANIRNSEGTLSGDISRFSWRDVLRPRVWVYLGIYSAIGLAILVSLVGRDRLDVAVQRDRNPLYVLLSDGAIRNGYTLKILNMQGEPRSFFVSVDGLADAGLSVAGDDSEPQKQIVTEVGADKAKSVRLFLRVPGDRLSAPTTEFSFSVASSDGTESKQAFTHFEAPKDIGK